MKKVTLVSELNQLETLIFTWPRGLKETQFGVFCNSELAWDGACKQTFANLNLSSALKEGKQKRNKKSCVACHSFLLQTQALTQQVQRSNYWINGSTHRLHHIFLQCERNTKLHHQQKSNHIIMRIHFTQKVNSFKCFGLWEIFYLQPQKAFESQLMRSSSGVWSC